MASSDMLTLKDLLFSSVEFGAEPLCFASDVRNLAAKHVQQLLAEEEHHETVFHSLSKEDRFRHAEQRLKEQLLSEGMIAGLRLLCDLGGES